MQAKLLLLLALVAIVVAAIGAAMLLLRPRALVPIGVFDSKPPLNDTEQAMFWRLQETFPLPNTVVLSQVSYDALLSSRGSAIQPNHPDGRADFVLLNHSFRVRAVISLDEGPQPLPPHAEEHDKMLRRAGYRVLRYRRVPDAFRLRNDVPIN